MLNLAKSAPDENALPERYFGHKHVAVIEPVRGKRSAGTVGFPRAPARADNAGHQSAL